MSVAFNQYYFDILKKVRALARDRKNDDKEARVILKGVKRHYASWDKESDEYRVWFNTAPVAVPWDAYVAIADQENGEGTEDLDAMKKWLSEGEGTEALLYKDIPAKNVAWVFGDDVAFHYFATILCILRRDLEKEEIKTVMEYLKGITKPPADLEPLLSNLADAGVVRLLKRAKRLHGVKRAGGGDKASATGAPGASPLGDIENTSLGKLAKEIMEEVDVSELQKNIGEDGDILKALANPDSGLLKLVGTVSQKMVSKMATGELNQESLLTDAMQFAAKMGGAIPGMGNLANIGELMSSVMGGAAGGMGGGAGGDGLDIGSLTSMMSQMMGGGLGARGGARGTGSGARANVNMPAMNQHLRRKKQARDMRQKLDDKKRAQENNTGDQ